MSMANGNLKEPNECNSHLTSIVQFETIFYTNIRKPASARYHPLGMGCFSYTVVHLIHLDPRVFLSARLRPRLSAVYAARRLYSVCLASPRFSITGKLANPIQAKGGVVFLHPHHRAADTHSLTYSPRDCYSPTHSTLLAYLLGAGLESNEKLGRFAMMFSFELGCVACLACAITSSHNTPPLGQSWAEDRRSLRFFSRHLGHRLLRLSTIPIPIPLCDIDVDGGCSSALFSSRLRLMFGYTWGHTLDYTIVGSEPHTYFDSRVQFKFSHPLSWISISILHQFHLLTRPSSVMDRPCGVSIEHPYRANLSIRTRGPSTFQKSKYINKKNKNTTSLRKCIIGLKKQKQNTPVWYSPPSKLNSALRNYPSIPTEVFFGNC